MTHTLTYQPKDSLMFHQHTYAGFKNDEDAAWHAKRFCDQYGYTLIDVKKNEA